MSVWLNDNDRHCCAWLRELVKAGELEGEVCERDIRELKAEDCTANQCHFFAGIGGWPYALRLAGWPSELPVWTGSCPCQPLSCAGKRRGHADERHLWPVWFDLIRQCRPATIFGEQVASRDGLEWLDGVFADLENEGYACAAADLCAAGVGAPHIRQRLYWVAYSECSESRMRVDGVEGHARQWRYRLANDCDSGRLGDTDGRGCRVGGNATRPECGGHAVGAGWAGLERVGDAGGARLEGLPERQSARQLDLATPGTWSSTRIIRCRDGKSRRIPLEPALFPLAHGIPGRVGLLRGYGNAIVPQVAATFVKAFMEVTDSA